MSRGDKSGITFEVELERPVTPRSQGPKRLQEKPKSKPLSPEELEEKQRKAEERRKAYEAAKLERIHVEPRPKKPSAQDNNENMDEHPAQ